MSHTQSSSQQTIDIPEAPGAASSSKAADPQRQRQPITQPPHAVVLHNDNCNTFEFVAATLQRIFGYSTSRAYLYTLRAHRSGRCVVWSGMKEHAEFKADQIRACGRDPIMASLGATPLRVSIEPLPG